MTEDLKRRDPKRSVVGPLDGPVGHVRQWVTYNPLTATYDTPDGTQVAAELVDNVQCLADVLYIAHIRAKQRDGEGAHNSR